MIPLSILFRVFFRRKMIERGLVVVAVSIFAETFALLPVDWFFCSHARCIDLETANRVNNYTPTTTIMAATAAAASTSSSAAPEKLLVIRDIADVIQPLNEFVAKGENIIHAEIPRFRRGISGAGLSCNVC